MHVLLDIVFCLFLLSTVLYWVSLTITKNSNLLKYSTTSLTILSNCLLFTYLGLRWIKGGYFPLSNLYESLLFLTWCLTSVQLVSEFKTSSKIIGSVIAPLNLLLITFSTSILPLEMQKTMPLVPALQSNWLMLHVSMMMVSYAILILGSLLSTLVLILSLRSFEPTEEYVTIRSDIAVAPLFDSKIKQFFSYSKEFEKTKSLNSTLSDKKTKLLFNLDNWSYRTIALGFPCLSLGIISGAVWANEAWGSYWSWDPKETWALITWIIFASYLHARLTRNWQGKKAAALGSLGFFVVWICYLGVNFLGTGLHSYGWLS
jgi:cytochrome c-type biogenesis protein CcsB